MNAFDQRLQIGQHRDILLNCRLTPAPGPAHAPAQPVLPHRKLVDAATDRARRNSGRCCDSGDPTIACRRRFRCCYQPASAFIEKRSYRLKALSNQSSVYHACKLC